VTGPACGRALSRRRASRKTAKPPLQRRPESGGPPPARLRCPASLNGGFRAAASPKASPAATRPPERARGRRNRAAFNGGALRQDCPASPKQGAAEGRPRLTDPEIRNGLSRAGLSEGTCGDAVQDGSFGPLRPRITGAGPSAARRLTKRSRRYGFRSLSSGLRLEASPGAVSRRPFRRGLSSENQPEPPPHVPSAEMSTRTLPAEARRGSIGLNPARGGPPRKTSLNLIR
jgi:hypothetical protein